MTEQDLISFGNYLLSDERRKLFEAKETSNGLSTEERLKQVGHWDLENWKAKR